MKAKNKKEKKNYIAQFKIKEERKIYCTIIFILFYLYTYCNIYICATLFVQSCTYVAYFVFVLHYLRIELHSLNFFSFEKREKRDRIRKYNFIESTIDINCSLYWK